MRTIFAIAAAVIDALPNGMYSPRRSELGFPV